MDQNSESEDALSSQTENPDYTLEYRDLPGFGDYIYARENDLPIEYIDYADYLVSESSYTSIIEDFISGKIQKDGMAITTNDLKDLLFAFTYRSNINDLTELYKSLNEVGALQTLNLESENRLQVNYSDWLDGYINSLSMTEKRYDAIMRDIENLEEFGARDEYVIPAPNIDTSHFESNIEVSDQINDLTSLFDIFQLSESFPALWYPSKMLFKTHISYKGNADFTFDSTKRETLYVLYGNKTAEIHVEDDKFKITTTLMGKKDREDLIKIFNNFPFPLENLQEDRVILTYQMKFDYPVSININSFLYTFMLNGFFSRYFHIMESNTLSTTNYIRLRYIFPFPDEFSEVISFQLRGNQTLETSRQSKSHISLSHVENEPEEFIEIRIQALSHDLVIDYVKIIARFIAVYLKQQEQADAIVSFFTPDNEPLINPKTRSTLSRRSVTSSVRPSSSRSERVFKSANPIQRYFVSDDTAVKEIREHLKLPSNYSGQCTRTKQPRVIASHLVEEFNKETFKINDKTYQRLAIPFQVEDKTIYIGCPDDRYPFIGIQSTRGNKIIPCCYRDDQNIEGKHLYNYLKGYDITTNRIFSSSTFQSFNIVPPATTGILPDSLDGLFKLFDPRIEFLRYGSVGGYQTLLHSILLATDEDYVNLAKRSGGSRNNDLDKYAMKVRHEIASAVTDDHLNVMKEVLPDLTYEEIRNILIDENSYIDPCLFIPLFEFYFGIRLLIFEMDEEKKIKLVQPDYMIFRGSYPVSYKSDLTFSLVKNRPYESIPLVAVFGQKNIRTSVPQWELIIHQERDSGSDESKKGQFRVIIEGEIADQLVMFFLDKVPTYQLHFDREQRLLNLSDRLWFNVHALLKWLSRISNIELRGQSIDTLGKTRVLYFNSFSLMIPPISPLPVRKIDDEPFNKNKVTNIKTLEKLFGKVKNVYRNHEGLFWRVDWIPGSESSNDMKISYFFRPVDKFEYSYEQIINTEIENFQTIPVWKEIAYYRKTAKRLHRILCYTFLKYMQQENNIRVEDVQILLDQWSDAFVLDEDVIYDFSNLYGNYPQGEYTDVIEQLRGTGLVHQTRDVLVLPSKKAQDNLFSYIKRWCLNREGVIIDRLYQVGIKGFYETTSDFKQWNNTRVYVGKNAVKAYLVERRNTSPPEVVKGPYKQISLLQTVDRWEYAALRSVSWQEDKINTVAPFEKIPKMKKMSEDELKRSAGITDTSKLLHYVEDQAPGRGIARPIYKAIIPLADGVD